MTVNDGTDWDNAFANMKHIPNAYIYLAYWTEGAQSFREQWENQERCTR